MELGQLMKRGIGMAALLLLAGILMVGGCESDSVAPHDELPAPTEAEAAQQAAIVATGLARVGPQLLAFQGPKPRDKELGVYEYDFPAGGDILGTIVLEYFNGGAPSLWDDADYGHLYSWDDPATSQVEKLEATLDLGGGLIPVVGLTFDIQGDINRTADTATVVGAGTFHSGDWSNAFTITEDDPVILSGVSTYPQGGMLIFNIGAISLLVIYDGDSTAGVVVGGIISYMIDLDTGIVTPVT